MRRHRSLPPPPLVALGAEWIKPYWLERQLDPRSPSFVPLVDLATPANVTLRNWTTVGTMASAATATVDPRGLLTPRPDGWSLDWWIGAEDRWHFPSRDNAVRQQLVDGTPVVETTMRIPGGDAVQRVYGVPGDLAVMEVTNSTPTPIAVGMAIRPFNALGPADVRRIGLHDRTVTVDGRPALLVTKRPSRMAASTFRRGDAVHLVTSEQLVGELDGDVRCDDGRATATFLFPLAHRQTLRVAVPLADRARSDDDVPESDAVVRSWQAQTANRGLRMVLPEGRLALAVEANRRAILLFRGEHGAMQALDHYGFHAEVAEVLKSSDDVSALAEHWRLSGSLEAVDPDAVARAATRIERTAPPDDVSARRSLGDAATLLRALGIDPVADQCARWAADRPSAVRAEPALEPANGPASVDDFGHTGFDPARTMELAGVELRAGDRACLERLTWLLDVASATFTWPSAVHPVLGAGSSGVGHDARVTAAFLSFVRHLLVRETVDGGLALCSMLPDGWTGQNLEVHDAPTHHGTISFALRWHGDRPALLWERETRDVRVGGGPVRITAPGLDPSWSTTDPRGEALLAAPAAPVVVEGSFN
ncbi:MAG TPA: hypothetical protein VM143_14950 [Acidimicrobiales bacterium]|nr:hypothetical protein [Acidimicrobiales bacterium]